MNFIEKIKTSIEGATGLPVFYHGQGELNLELDQILAGQVVAYFFLIEEGSIVDENGRFHERLTFSVFFVQSTEFDFDAMENEDKITECKKYAFEWLSKLRSSRDIKLESVNNSGRVYDTMDAILTGYAVNVTLQEYEGWGVCDFPERK